MTILASVAAGLLVGILLGWSLEKFRDGGTRDLHAQIIAAFRAHDEVCRVLVEVQRAWAGARPAPISEPRLRVIGNRFNTADEGGEQA